MLNVPLAIGAIFLVLSSSVSASGGSHACSRTGFVAHADNAHEFYACELSSDGGYSMRLMRCQDNFRFSSKLGRCVDSARFALPADGSDIENPTIPPDNLDESTTTEVPETTNVAPMDESTEDPEPTDESTEAPATGETSAPTEAPSTDDTSASSDDTTEAPVTGETSAPTEAPSTDETSEPSDDTTEAPVTGEPSASTEAPSTEETSEPSDDTTEAPVTGETSSPTDAPSTPGSTESTATTDIPATTEKPTCATTGALPVSGNCSKYILCYTTDDGEVAPLTQDCPGSMQFSAWDRYCKANYDCETD
ncbi:hypothetical protein KR222_004558 [Zaprionus bogoriensis]|nr:hypothetical protein KR222_004558 [Zaprionus bogoriensis]